MPICPQVTHRRTATFRNSTTQGPGPIYGTVSCDSLTFPPHRRQADPSTSTLAPRQRLDRLRDRPHMPTAKALHIQHGPRCAKRRFCFRVLTVRTDTFHRIARPIGMIVWHGSLGTEEPSRWGLKNTAEVSCADVAGVRARVSTGRARLRSDTAGQVQGPAHRERDAIAHPFARAHQALIPVYSTSTPPQGLLLRVRCTSPRWTVVHRS
jgi:hypothetical protein